MATIPVPTAPTTAIGWKLGVQVKPAAPATPGAYTDCPWVNKINKPKRSIDGAEASTLSGPINLETPTRPKLEASGTMWVVDGDPGYGILRDSCKQYPVSILLFQMTAPWGATKSFEGWISSWDPSEYTDKENRSVDFTISVTTPETDVAAPTS